MRAEWGNASQFGCPCLGGATRYYSPTCCAGWTGSLLPESLDRPFMALNASRVLQAMADDLGDMYASALESREPWLTYLDTGERAAYAAWNESRRAQDEARFNPTQPVAEYASQSEALVPLQASLWDVCHAALKQTFFTLPLVPEGKKTASIHTTFVSGKAASPLFNDPIEVRLMGCSTNMTGTYAWMYNVQTSKRGEFGVGAKTRSKYSDEWTLAEWSVDNATQSYHFYINGQEVTDIAVSKGAGKFEGAELPAVYDSLTFGWLNYQAAAGEGFTVWIDDLALSKSRIGPTSAK
jgi:hypothetical protein